MPEHFASIGEAIGSAMAHNARAAADLAAAQHLAAQPAPGEPARDCPACEAGIPHTEHCPTPETHNWGCGCPTDAMRQDTGQDSAPGPSSYPYLDTLGVLLSRMVRGVLLEAERPLLREHVEHLLTDRSRSEHAASRLMEQRQEMAEERYVWQERGRKAEAALTRLDQMATAWVEQLPSAISTATAVEAIHQVTRAALASPTETDESADGQCEQHPGAPVIGDMCGGCTVYPADMR
ncbi:hypothetical protein [Streptomyces lydicus]|uniref:hypothetical protein n=1 Tax=Streptomyces lydicus TaxID=47763 RepID=UPI003711DE93